MIAFISRCLAAVLITLSSPFVQAQSTAEPPTAELVSIMRSVLPVDAELNEDTHRRFWALLSSLPRSDQETFVSLIGKMSVHDLRRQRAMWQSIQLTLKQKAVAVAPEYHAANQRMREAMVARKLSTARFDEQVAAFDAHLAAVAAGEPISHGGRQVVLDQAMVDQVIAGIDGSYDRLQRLLEARWQP